MTYCKLSTARSFVKSNPPLSSAVVSACLRQKEYKIGFSIKESSAKYGKRAKKKSGG
jgi:hypothetical protein